MTTIPTTPAPSSEGGVDPLTQANIAKAYAEARAAEKLAEFHEAMTVRANEEAIKLREEAQKAAAEAENMRQQNVLVGIAAGQAKRAEADELAADRNNHVYNFNKDVSSGSVKEAIGHLTGWMRKSPGCDIEIIFNSHGGSMVDGFAFYDFIQFLRRSGHHVTTSALGIAASMAGILLQAGDKRVMGKQAWLMIHEGSFGVAGKVGDVEDTVEWVKKVQERILDIFAEKSTLSKVQLKNKWKRKDWWISADEALQLGLVDEVR